MKVESIKLYNILLQKCYDTYKKQHRIDNIVIYLRNRAAKLFREYEGSRDTFFNNRVMTLSYFNEGKPDVSLVIYGDTLRLAPKAGTVNISHSNEFETDLIERFTLTEGIELIPFVEKPITIKI